jgi:hypothetical protein
MLLSFLEERDIPRRGREARDWLTTDERGRVIGLIVASIAISILASLLATALVGFVERRRGAGEPGPEPDPAMVPVMDAPGAAEEPSAPPTADVAVTEVGASA